jgi:hypothetical protein
MTRLAIALAAVLGASTMSATEAEAKGPSGGGKSYASSRGAHQSRSHHSHHGHYNHHRHHHHHGHHHSHYRSRDYRSWSYYCWYPRFGCYCCYCPTACEWFYYYEPSQCYLPVSQISTYTPSNINVNVNNNNNQNVVGGGGVPALPVSAAPISGGLTPALPGGPGPR